MCKVLVVDNDSIERYVTREVLNRNFNTIDIVFEADNDDEAFKMIKENRFDLIISNMSYSVVNLMKLVNFAKHKNPEAAVILTTAKSEKEVAHAVLKLKADGYLLKPFNPELLISAAKPYIIKKQLENIDLNNKKTVHALNQLRAGVRQHEYKKCINLAKIYLNDVYDEDYDSNEICEMVVEYLKGITDIAKEYRLEIIEMFNTMTTDVKLKFNKYGLRYNTYTLVSDIITKLFDELDKDYCYVDDVTKVLNYIDRNIKCGITLEEAAEHVNMSSCYFSKLFKKTTNENFITYVTNSRIELAKEMLRFTTLPILNIAFELSYSETNYFSKAFKKKVGITPTEYREQYYKEK